MDKDIFKPVWLREKSLQQRRGKDILFSAAGEKTKTATQKGRKRMKKVGYFLAGLFGSGLLLAEFSSGRLGSRIELVYGFLLLLGVIAAAAIDIQRYEIPGFIQLYFLLLGILRMGINRQLWNPLLAFCLMGGLLLGIAVVTGGQLGGGDIKLMALAGLSLGVRNVFLALAIGSVVGSVLGLALIATGRIRRDTPLPFGAFLGVGIFLAYLYGESLWQWYLG